MLIQYRTAGGSTGYVTLADPSAGDVVREWSPDAALGSVQRENLAAAVGQLNSSYRQPLGNIATKLSINLSANYATAAAAAAAGASNQVALLGSKNHFKYTEGTTVLYFPNAVCSRCRWTPTGREIEYQIELETDLVTTYEPS